MNDFESLLAADFVFKPQGKLVPMAASLGTHILTPGSNGNFALGQRGTSRSTRSTNSFHRSFMDNHDQIFSSLGAQKSHDYVGSAKDSSISSNNLLDFDSMFRGSSNSGAKSSSLPVFNKPIYDDDMFDGLSKNSKSNFKVNNGDVFWSMGSATKEKDAFDDLPGGFDKKENESKSFGRKESEKDENGVVGFDDMIPGFCGSSASCDRPITSSWSLESTVNLSKKTSNGTKDPFVVLESTSSPALASSGPSVGTEGVYDCTDHFDGHVKSLPAFSSEKNNRGKDRRPLRTDPSSSGTQTSASKEPTEKPSVRGPEGHSLGKMLVNNDQESDQMLFDIPKISTNSHKSVGQTASPPSSVNASSNEANIEVDMSPRSEENSEVSDDIWLTVEEISLFTQSTTAPPPSRPPPPVPARKKGNEFSSSRTSSQYSQGPKSVPAAMRSSVVSPLEEFEDFSMNSSRNNVEEHVFSNEELEMNSVAAAMKEAMDRAQAKLRHAKEVRQREKIKAARNKEAVQLEKDERATQDAKARLLRGTQEGLDFERLQMQKEEDERKQRKLERERERAKQLEREREEKEREQRQLEKEKERERVREIESEREKARKAVARATRETRERAAAEACLKAERAALEKANAEARECAERAAVQRAHAEARERAAAEAKKRAEKAAAEARERANAEARERKAQARAAEVRVETGARCRAERAVVERAAAEARERAAAAARVNQQKNAAMLNLNQQRNENGIESFFNMGVRASNASRPMDDSLNRRWPEEAKASAGTASSMSKACSTTNIVDDLTSIFGEAAASSGEFKEIEGESKERRRARLERHLRTQERAAKTLAEKNQRDLQTQREQAERYRIAEILDVEIKRWAAGKEGNLRSLLSTLQYVLWPGCGWEPVSLTDLITTASVKKLYRKATLCIHPDKVQQKGANLQQKCIAEKVFDLLKEAWNKFNSEQLY